MAFVDLSTPQQQTASASDNNDRPVSNNSVSSMPASPNDNQNNSSNLKDDDQGLLRDIPEDLTSNAKITDKGIVESSGPPINLDGSKNFTAPGPSEQAQNRIIKDSSLSLSGSAKDQEKQVSNILDNADKLINKQSEEIPKINTQSSLAGGVISSQNPKSIKLAGTAREKEEEVTKILSEADNLINQQQTAQSSELIKQQKIDQININKQKATPSAVVEKNINKIKQPPQKITNDIELLKNVDLKQGTNDLTIDGLMSLAEEKDASDLHLSVGYPPLLRIDGKLVDVSNQPLNASQVDELLNPLLKKDQKEKLDKDLDIDFSYSHTTGTRFRINIYYNKGQLGGAFRLIPSRIRTISELGLPRILYDMLDVPQGLIILAGPTGSGKSTTIAAMVQEINMNKALHIITLEDPIEYVFNKSKSLVNQREIGTDVTDFKRGLREVLRQDPDVILVGEMRDFETIAMAVTAAETGHLVFATLHTNSASQTVDRIIDVFPDVQQAQIRAQLSNVITAVISQRLVPIKGGGRKAVSEIMIATPAIKNAIRENKTYQIDNMIQTNAELGMITLEKSLLNMIRTGEISLEEAQNYTTKPDELISLLKDN